MLRLRVKLRRRVRLRVRLRVGEWLGQFTWPRQTQYMVPFSSSSFSSCHNSISMLRARLRVMLRVRAMLRARLRVRLRVRAMLRARLRVKVRVRIRCDVTYTQPNVRGWLAVLRMGMGPATGGHSS